MIRPPRSSGAGREKRAKRLGLARMGGAAWRAVGFRLGSGAGMEKRRKTGAGIPARAMSRMASRRLGNAPGLRRDCGPTVCRAVGRRLEKPRWAGRFHDWAIPLNDARWGGPPCLRPKPRLVWKAGVCLGLNLFDPFCSAPFDHFVCCPSLASSSLFLFVFEARFDSGNGFRPRNARASFFSRVQGAAPSAWPGCGRAFAAQACQGTIRNPNRALFSHRSHRSPPTSSFLVPSLRPLSL